jgi:PAS domain S-box-containing protein
MIIMILRPKDADDLPRLAPVAFDNTICLGDSAPQSVIKEESLMEILDHLPYGLFITDDENKISYFNKAAELITGVPMANAIGRHCREVFKSGICENDCTLKKLGSSKNNIYIREFDIEREDGETFPIICTTSPIPSKNGFSKKRMYVFNDIVDRRRLEGDLKLYENRYQRIFQGSKDMIFVTSKDGSFNDANQACLDLLGYDSKEELLSLQSVEEVYHNVMHWRVFREQIDRHGFIRDFEACFRKKDGTVLHCLMSGNAVRINGDIVGYEAIAKDITARMDGLRLLKERHRRLSLLHSVAVAMNVTRDLDDILLVALKKLLDVLGLSSGGIFLIDHNEPGFVLRAQQGLLASLGGSSCHALFHDVALKRSLLKKNFPLKPRGTFPPFKATLRNTTNGNSLEVTCYLITRKERASGFIALQVPPGRHIGDEDHRMIGSLGNFLGSAIENSRLLQAVEQHREELEGLTARLFHSQEVERKRIAQELHDEAGQALTGINFTLETILKSLTPDLEQVKEQILEVRKRINRTYQEIRSMSHRLHPAVLTDLGLEPALESYLSDISRYSKLDIDFKMVGFEKRLDTETETVLYRIAQEVVTNTLKHSGAELFKLFIVRSYPHIIFIAEDDGVGFDPDKLDKGKQALGLLCIRERVASLGGTFSLCSSKGEGTRIRIEIPVPELQDEC